MRPLHLFGIALGAALLLRRKKPAKPGTGLEGIRLAAVLPTGLPDQEGLTPLHRALVVACGPEPMKNLSTAQRELIRDRILIPDLERRLAKLHETMEGESVTPEQWVYLQLKEAEGAAEGTAHYACKFASEHPGYEGTGKPHKTLIDYLKRQVDLYMTGQL